MYKCEHFKIHELVPPIIYNAIGEKAWNLMDVRILIDIDMLRERYGPMIINNWYWGGPRKYSGLRPLDCPEGAYWSQHKYGRAVDIIRPSNRLDLKSPVQIRADMFSNRYQTFATCLEMGISWLHMDVRNWDKGRNGFLKIYPKKS